MTGLRKQMFWFYIIYLNSECRYTEIESNYVRNMILFWIIITFRYIEILYARQIKKYKLVGLCQFIFSFYFYKYWIIIICIYENNWNMYVGSMQQIELASYSIAFMEIIYSNAKFLSTLTSRHVWMYYTNNIKYRKIILNKQF